MNKVAKKLTHALIICGLVFITTSCSTTPPDPARIARMQFIAEAAAYNGATVDLISNPTHRPAFQAGLVSLNLLLDKGDFSPESFAAALKALPVKELQGAQGSLVINNAIILWKEYAAETVNLDQTVYINPILTSVRDGLARALNEPPPASATHL